MEHLVTQFIPHAPKLGLHVYPSIAPKLYRNALRDYAEGVSERDVVALYDNTWLGNGKDGVVFTAQFLVFQNSDLNKPQRVWYREIVNAVMERKRLGGAVLHIDVNTGHTTITESIDFGAHPKALHHVHTFIQEAMRAVDAQSLDATTTNWPAVQAALLRLRDSNELTIEDYNRLMACAR